MSGAVYCQRRECVCLGRGERLQQCIDEEDRRMSIETETAYQRDMRLARERRERQEARDEQFYRERNHVARRTGRMAARQRRERRPAWGSQEWAETRDDDLGESYDG